MKNISFFLVLSLFVSGCFGFHSSIQVTCSPVSILENIATVRLHVTDKESGLPIRNAAVGLNIVKSTVAKDGMGKCYTTTYIQDKITCFTDDNGTCEATFAALYTYAADYYILNYTVGKEQFEKVTGSSHIDRDAERTIEVRMLNNTTQP